MQKTKIVLALYALLKDGEQISLEGFCNEHQISVPTFRRYMSLVREFVWEKHLEEIVYDKDKKVYVIKSSALNKK